MGVLSRKCPHVLGKEEETEIQAPEADTKRIGIEMHETDGQQVLFHPHRYSVHAGP